MRQLNVSRKGLATSIHVNDKCSSELEILSEFFRRGGEDEAQDSVWDTEALLFPKRYRRLTIEAADLDEFEEIMMDVAPELIIANSDCPEIAILSRT